MNAAPLDTDTIDNQFERIANRYGWSDAQRAAFGPSLEHRAFIVEHERRHAEVARASDAHLVELAPNRGP